MTQEEILEGNKLIAEFMGYEGQHELWCGNNILDDTFYGDKEMRPYNPQKCWDDLMPVIKKMREIEDAAPKNWNRQLYDVNQALGTLDILTVWKNIVYSIKWYNQNSK